MRVIVLLLVLSFVCGCSAFVSGNFQDSEIEVVTSSEAKEDYSIPPVADAKYHFILGEMAINDGNLDRALSEYEEVIKLDPNPSRSIHLRLIQLYVRASRLDEAYRQVESALVADPKDAQLLQLKAGILAALKRTDEAIAVYRELIATNVDTSEEIYVLLSTLYSQTGRGTEGVELLQDLLKKSPKSTVAHYYMAKLYESQGKKDEADRYFKKTIQLSPNNDAIEIDYTRFLAAQKRFKEALQICDRVLKRDPENELAKKIRAQLLVVDNKYGEAISQLEELGKSESDATETRLRIALIKLEQQDFHGAVTDLNLVLTREPNYHVARYYLAVAYGGLKNTNAAVGELQKIPNNAENYTQAKMYEIFLLQQENKLEQASQVAATMISYKPQNPRLYALKASIDQERGAYAEALDGIKKASELDPKNDGFIFTYGVYLDKQERKEESYQKFERVIELNPKNANAYNYLGYSLAERGVELDRAIKLIGQAIELEPDNGYFIDSLGWVYFQKGQYIEAERELERAVKVISTDAVILEHLAQAKFKVGKLREALDVAHKAQQFVKQSDDKEVGPRLEKLISEVEKKLNQ